MPYYLPALSICMSPNYSARSAKIRLVVVHDCEGSGTASLSWLTEPESQVSAHYLLTEDGQRAFKMVDDRNKAWHVCGANSISIGIEAAGYSSKGLGAAEWKSLASITAVKLKQHGIPCQRATAVNNWTGYCQHADLGAWGGGHHDITHDPTVYEAFDKLVEDAFNDPSLPINWGNDGNVMTQPPVPPAGLKPSPNARHDLEVGTIAWVQMRLNALHVMSQPLIVDGLDGPNTRRAVRVFQDCYGLEADGIAGPLTIAGLEKPN